MKAGDVQLPGTRTTRYPDGRWGTYCHACGEKIGGGRPLGGSYYLEHKCPKKKT